MIDSMTGAESRVSGRGTYRMIDASPLPGSRDVGSIIRYVPLFRDQARSSGQGSRGTIGTISPPELDSWGISVAIAIAATNAPKMILAFGPGGGISCISQFYGTASDRSGGDFPQLLRRQWNRVSFHAAGARGFLD